MIKINISANDIKVTGHAGYAKKGEDIVCASVSTAVTMCINQIEIFDLMSNIEYEVKEGYLMLHVVRWDDVLEKIVKNFLYTLSELERDYPYFVKIREC